MNKYEQRMNRLQLLLPEKGLDGLYISSSENVSYFTGTSGHDCTLWITCTGGTVITDFRYREMAESLSWLNFYETSSSKQVYDLLSGAEEKRIGIEKNYLSLSDYLLFTDRLHSKELIPTEGLVEGLRMIKDPEEIEYTRQAAAIGNKAFDYVCGLIRPGMTEKQLAFELEFFMRKNGADALSFDTIAISGPNTSKPHGVSTDKPIENGDFVTMDYGCKVNGYCSDMTRTVAVGYASDEMKKVYDIVLRAQLAVCDRVRAGMTGKEIDSIARDIISDAGYGEYFGHGLGHGTGLQIHEAPRFSPSYDKVIEENTIVSIEPGIYLPGKFGVRIEDLAIIKADGIMNLVYAPKELIIL